VLQNNFSEKGGGNLKNKNLQINNIWLEITSDVGGTNWLKPDVNVKYIQSFADEAKKLNKVLGIKTRSDWWQTVTKGSTAFTSLPLWNDDSKPFTDIFGDGSTPDGVYKPYGGWATPTVQTPAGQKRTLCTGSQFLIYNSA